MIELYIQKLEGAGEFINLPATIEVESSNANTQETLRGSRVQ